MPVIYVGSGDNASTTVRYVALGDSIAYGYGLSDRENDSYVGKVKKYLESRYDYVIVSNFGCNGQESSELLDILTNPANENHRKYCATLQYADYITLSIGSNDLLHHLKFELDMEEMVRREEPHFQEACRRFAVNFPEIIEEIRKINPHARIYANNIYNPAKGLSDYEGIYDAAESYINWLNHAFYNSGSYHLVDIKHLFDVQEKSMINVSLNGGKIDPHPSKEGHALIAKMIIKEMAH